MAFLQFLLHVATHSETLKQFIIYYEKKKEKLANTGMYTVGSQKI